VISPNDDLTTIEITMRDYNVRWLVLEAGSIVPALVPVLQRGTHPAWLSEPIAMVFGTPAAVANSALFVTPRQGGGVFEAPAANPQVLGAVYAVCLLPDDVRCAQ
jgi:hypothetical protein